MKIRIVYDVLKDSVSVFRQSKGPLLGAALAFYTTLSLSPLLLVIVAIAGNAVSSPEDVGAGIRRFAPGDTAEVTIERDGGQQKVTVTLGTRPDTLG